MANSIQRDSKKRTVYSKHEIKRLVYKSLMHDLKLSRDARFQIMRDLNRLPRNSSKTRIKNRCILTGRGHAIYRFSKLSRIKLRELASNGVLMGIKKSTW
jgi:small subunit ribosomal protein S14